MKALVCSLIFFCAAAIGANQPINGSTSQFSYMPRVYLGGESGTDVLGQADVLVPLALGNNYNFSIYGQGLYNYEDESWATDSWTSSLGLSYRQIFANSALLGAYVLGDYSRTASDHYLFQLNPGLEALGKTWDFRLNGYIPLGDKKWTKEGWADTFGNYNYVKFTGHDQYDAWFIYHEETGLGADAEIGRKLFKVKKVLVKAYLDGYYFNMEHRDDVVGGGARITVQPKNYLEIFCKDSYDNYNENVFTVGFQLSLNKLFSSGSKQIDENDLQARLFDPIERNFAELGSGSDVRVTGGPRDKDSARKEDDKPEVLLWYNHNAPERTNIWFFTPGGTPAATSSTIGDGTYENPFIGDDFNQQTVTKIYDDTLKNGLFSQAYLYFAGGYYNSFTPGTPYQPIEFFSGESIWGRMGENKGFQMPATDNNRPLFIGGIKLNSNTSVNDLRLQNDSPVTEFTNGISLDNAQNVGVNNVLVGTNNSTTGYKIGIDVENNSSLAITNSDIFGYNDELQDDFINTLFGSGVKVSGNSSIVAINNSRFSGISENGIGMGLYITGNSAVIGDINNSHFSGLGLNEGAVGYGVFANTIGNLTIGNITNSTFGNTVAANTNGNNNNFGFSATSSTGKLSVGNITNSNFTGTGFGYSFHVSSSIGTTVGNIDNSDFFGESAPSFFGYSLTNNLTIGSIKNSNFTTSGASNIGYGFYLASPFGNISTGDISNSNFSGSGVDDSIGFRIEANSGNVNVGNITDSRFTGNSSTKDGTGFYINTAIGSINIGEVKNSTFTGTGLNNGMGLFAQGIGGISIGDIINSSFTGNANSVAYGANIIGGGVLGGINIGNITNSNFTANATAGIGGFGFQAYAANNVTIGNITGSSFIDNSPLGYGFYAVSDSGYTLQIGSVTGSSFSGPNSSMYLIGGIVNVNGTNYTATSAALKSYLLSGNTVNGLVCVNGVCA